MTTQVAPHPGGARGSALMTTALTVALFGVAALYCNPLWFDAEVAHRFVAIGALGVLVLARPGQFAARPSTAGILWIGLLLAHGAALLTGVANLPAGLVWLAWLLTGFAAMQWGQGLSQRQVAIAWLPIAGLVALLGCLELLLPGTFPIGGGPGFGGGTATLGNRNAASELVALGVVAAGWLALGPSCRTRLAALGVLAVGLAFLSLEWAGARGGLLASALGLGWLLVSSWRQAPDRAPQPSSDQGDGILIGLLKEQQGKAPATRRLVPMQLVLVLLTAVAGLTMGWSLQAARPAPTTDHIQTAAVEAAGRNRILPSSTGMVRIAMWGSTAELALESPLLGHGAGQFPVEYPRVRSEAERDLTSFGRSFLTLPRAPHNDHIQVLAEAGILGLGLWCAFWSVGLLMLWRTHGPMALAIPITWLVLATVRAPLSNAPAALLVWVWLGAALPSRATVPLRSGQALGIRISSAVLLALGIGATLGYSDAAHWLEQQKARNRLERGRTENRATPENTVPLLREEAATLATAATSLPWEDRVLELQAQVLGFLTEDLGRQVAAAGEREQVQAQRQEVLQRMLALAPHHPGYRVTAAEAAMQTGDLRSASLHLDRLLELDPRNPRAAQLRAKRAFLQQQPSEAIAALMPADPPAALAQVAGPELLNFATEATRRGWQEDAAHYRNEGLIWKAAHLLHGVTTVEGLGELHRDAIQTAISAMVRECTAQGTLSSDRRPWLLRAAWAAAKGDAFNARQLAGTVQGIPAPIPPGWARHLAPAVAPLRSMPVWDGLLPEMP